MSSFRIDPNLLKKKYPNAITQDDIDLKNRFFGVLPGLAVGDALGAGVEGLPSEEIVTLYPDGLREIVGGGALDWERGAPTDDTQLALVLAESLVAARGLDLGDLSRRLVEWLNSNPKGMGRLTRTALENLRGGDSPSESGAIAWEDSGREAAGNGSAMYCAPLGLLHLKLDDRRVEDAVTVSRITHYDPRCVGSCVAITSSIAWLVQGEDDALFRAAQAAAPWSDPVRAVIERGLARPPSEITVDGEDAGSVLTTVEIAFSAAAHAESFESGLVEVISRGGDTDTNAAVAGALLGAKFGRSAIPERWLKTTLAVPRLVALTEELHRHATGR